MIWLIASTYKYMILANEEWPDLLKFINDLILSTSPDQHLVREDRSLQVVTQFVWLKSFYRLRFPVWRLHAEHLERGICRADEAPLPHHVQDICWHPQRSKQPKIGLLRTQVPQEHNSVHR